MVASPPPTTETPLPDSDRFVFAQTPDASRHHAEFLDKMAHEVMRDLGTCSLGTGASPRGSTHAQKPASLTWSGRVAQNVSNQVGSSYWPVPCEMRVARNVPSASASV